MNTESIIDTSQGTLHTQDGPIYSTRPPRKKGDIGARLPTALLVLLVTAGCQDDSVVENTIGTESADEVAAAQRWYSSAQVERGASVFAQHCADCHGDSAQGLTEDWRTRLPDGSFPPPPLNGSAHAWHHPLAQLLDVINTGGIPYGGQMPPFEDQLSDDEKSAAIAYFQSFWNDEIYEAWLDRGGLD